MNKKELKEFLRENIIRLLEEETQYNPGDQVETSDGTGIVQLSKHPYYSVKLDSTGVTKSFHYTELQESEPIESEFGKYNIDETLDESSPDKLIKFSGILIIHEGELMSDILSDIRSLQGVTIVRSEDMGDNDYDKSKLHIKVDPYPYGNQINEKIESYLIKKISQIPGVKSFIKAKHIEKPGNDLSNTTSPIPVASIKDLKESKIRIKI